MYTSLFIISLVAFAYLMYVLIKPEKFQLPVTIYSAFSSAQGSFAYNAWVLLILFVTLLFANFAEAIAEARGKAQSNSLRKTREESTAKLYVNGNIKIVSSSSLKKGDEFVCDAGDVIPADGEIVEVIDSSVRCFHRAANYGRTLRGRTCLAVCLSGDYYNWHVQGHYGSTRNYQRTIRCLP